MRIGTRASALALVQARHVAQELGGELVRAEIFEITTSGDRGENFSDKARWTSEIELALVDGRIDVAVHSAKDVPAELAEGTQIVIPAREDPRDVICGAPSLEALTAGARIGTSSLRRAAQIKALHPELEIVELRGNVDTRLRKLADGEADAIVLAYAGLKRLGREQEAGGFLDALVPAAGQGALALQVRVSDSEVADAVGTLADPSATTCVTAERELTLALGASCRTAVGAFAKLVQDSPNSADPATTTSASSPANVSLIGWVGLPDGTEWIADSIIAATPEAAAAELARRLIAVGAKDLLARAEEAAE